MKITCQSCGAKYTIADDKVSGRRVKVRCRSCATPIVVDAMTAGADAAHSIDAMLGLEPEASSLSAPEPDRLSSIEISMPEVHGWSVNLSESDQRTMSTEQIVAGFRDGTVTDDAYVWKDGMADWRPILEVPELKKALEGSRTSSPNKAPVAARVSGGRARGAADLFGAPGMDESFADPNSSPPIDQRPAGARNENSVLFSLDALKAGFAPPTPTARTESAPRAPAPSGDDPFGMSRGNSGLINMGAGNNALFSYDNQALLTAPAAPPPREPEVVRAASPVTGASPMSMPLPMAAPKAASKLPLVLGGGAALLAVIIVLFFVLKPSSKPGVPPADSAQTSVATPPAEQKLDEPQKPAEPAAEKAAEKPNEPAPSAAATPEPAPSAAASAAGPVTEADKKRFAEQLKKQEEEKRKPAEEKKSEKTEKAEPAAVADGPPFSKGAAIAALSAASSAASSCKRPGGPTGGGKAVVTFAPSGRVTTANVSGGSFGGTPVGGCVASIFRRAKIPAFGGGPVTVSKSFSVAP